MACSVKLFTAYRQLFINNNNDLLKEIIDKCRQKISFSQDYTFLSFCDDHSALIFFSILQEDFATRFMSCNNKELIQGAEEFLNSLQENYILSLFGFLSSLLEAHSTWFLPCTNRYVEEFLIFLQYYLCVRLLIFLWDGIIFSNISSFCRQLSQHYS